MDALRLPQTRRDTHQEGYEEEDPVSGESEKRISLQLLHGTRLCSAEHTRLCKAVSTENRGTENRGTRFVRLQSCMTDPPSLIPNKANEKGSYSQDY